MKFNELDVVKTKKSFREHGINKGDVGVIVFSFSSPNEAYEVEFDDGTGRPRAISYTAPIFRVGEYRRAGHKSSCVPRTSTGAVTIMFKTIIKKAVKVPELNHIHIVGTDTTDSVKIGDFITGGIKKFEITSIPIIRRVDDAVIDEVNICISSNGFDLNDIVGKSIYAV